MPSATGVRLTLKFNFGQQIRFTGWSESYDLGYADLPSAITATNNISAFIRDRVNCLGLGPVLIEAVLSAYVQPLAPGAPSVRRNTYPFPIPKPPNPGLCYNSAFAPAGDYTADFAPTVYYMTAQTALSSSPAYRRNIWIAGLPDVADVTDSAEIINPIVLPFVETFIGDLSNVNRTNAGRNNVSLRSIDRSGANPIKQCTAWNLGANSYTVPAHGFAQNQPVIAIGMKTAPGGTKPSGRYLVAAVIDANTITLQGATVPSAPVRTGGFRAAVYTFNAIAVVRPLGFTKRDKGAPFGLARGRHKTPPTVRA